MFLIFTPCVALCCRTFKDHTLIFLQTKRLAHKLRILLGLIGLNVAELHGDLTMLQVSFFCVFISLFHFLFNSVPVLRVVVFFRV